MARQEIIEIIKKSVGQGVSREQLVSDLIFAGFNYREIQGALNEMAANGQLSQSFLSSISRRGQRTPQAPKIQKIGEAAAEGVEVEISAKDIIKKYKKRFLIFIALIVVIFGGTAAALYLYGTSSSVVVKRVLANLSSVSSLAYYLKSNVVVDRSGNDPLLEAVFEDNVTMESSGTIDFSGNDAIKFSTEITAKNGFDSTSSSVWDTGFISTAPADWFIKINYIATTTQENKTLYDQLSLGWTKVDAPPESLSGLVPQKLISKIANYRGLISPQISQIVKLASDPAIIAGITSLSSENIGGSNYYHYQITFQKDKISNVISQFYSTLGENSGPLVSLVDNPWDIWISKKTSVLYRIKINALNQISGHTFNPQGIDLYLSGFNENYSISNPPQANSLVHILEITKIQQ